ncbi:hypothetical protein ACJX0J_037145, partial [Zea mays]
MITATSTCTLWEAHMEQMHLINNYFALMWQYIIYNGASIHTKIKKEKLSKYSIGNKQEANFALIKEAYYLFRFEM